MTNWKAIDASDIWHGQIQPFVEELRADALEDMAAAADADKFRYWQGYATALKKVAEMPLEMIEAERMSLVQEKEEDGRRDVDRRDRFARIRRAIGIGGGRDRGGADTD